MVHSKLFYSVLAECKDCIRQWKTENGGMLPIIYGDYINHCWNYGGRYLHDSIDSLMTEENVEDITPILEYELMVENVGLQQANRIRIGQRIRELREEQGLTSTQLADMCGLTQSTISKIENGRWSASIDILSRICEALDARVDIIQGVES